MAYMEPVMSHSHSRGQDRLDTPTPTKKLDLRLGTDPSLFHVAGSTPKICLYLNWLGAHQCERSYPGAFVAAEEHSFKLAGVDLKSW